MTLAQALSTYINLNLLIVLGFLALAMFSAILRKQGVSIKSKTELELNYFVVAIVLSLSIIHPLLPANKIFQPAAKVWSAQSIKTFSHDYNISDQGGYLSLPTLNASMGADHVTLVWIFLFFVLFIGGAIVMTRSLRSLLRIRRNSFLTRRYRSVRIYINDQIQVPFSYWLPFQANVVVPSSLVQKRGDYQMAIAHELQHHHHQDTKWVYVLWGLRLICVVNPFVHLWGRSISEIQEFACDETLVDQHKVESRAYARCLVEVAQTAIDHKYEPVCATGLTFLIERNILKRRIEKMFTNNTTRTGRQASVIFALALTTIMAATAFASKSVVQDRRVSMDQALVMAKKSSSDFPVVVNDLVLQQLNRYIGTPEGREFMRSSLERMESYRAQIESKVKEYNAPVELMAIPVVESGYQNLPESNKMGWGAGLWMFIAPTARNYGLKVDRHVDERMNVDLLTDAAMRYLQSNFLRFKDWPLAILAYNVGENELQKAIDKTGAKDVWTLIRQGHENDRDYLPKVMAAVLIMKNPDSVK